MNSYGIETKRPDKPERPKNTAVIRSVARLPILLTNGAAAHAQIISFRHLSDNGEHFALQFERLTTDVPLMRLHSECLTGDALGSARCDCGPQLHEALQRLHQEGGLLLYLRQEGRGIGLYRKLEAYCLQEQGLDTFSANRALGHKDDERSYQVAADMLYALDIPKIRLLSNNPDKANQLMDAGIHIAACLPTGVYCNADNSDYLSSKVRFTSHAMELPRIYKDTP